MNQTANLHAGVEFPALQIGGELISFERPRLMGILNVNDESFFSGSRISNVDEALRLASRHADGGAMFLDIGAASTKPGSVLSDPEEEWLRLKPVLIAVRKAYPELFISVDTYHASVAEYAVDAGADLINDVSSGRIDSLMIETVLRLRVPYVVMHMQGTPENMQKNPVYEDVLVNVLHELASSIQRLRSRGLSNIIADVGFGFGKTVRHNYDLIRQLSAFHVLNAPILVGISRKSMVTRVLNVTADEALNGTTALHMLALLHGANILRVHDVREAAEAIRIFEAYQGKIS